MTEKRAIERRSEPRHATSLPVWWRGAGHVGTQHGWMLDLSGHGAAMLTPRQDCPVVGERVDVSLLDPNMAAGPGVSQSLLRRATVCRRESVAPSLERVALNFDSGLWKRDVDPAWEDLSGVIGDRLFP